MNSFEKFLYFLQSEMPEPTRYGWYHLLWLFLIIVSLIILYERKKYYSEHQLKLVLGIYGIVALTTEVLKQLSWSFNYDQVTGIVTWDYEWYAFPFQLCSTPIYVSLICLLLKNGKLRDNLLSYLSYVTILGSIATMILPDSCFTSNILVNIHTMWLHFGSFVVSVYLLLTGTVKINFKSLKNALITFLFFLIIANSMNIFIYQTGILQGETFNMFYISPYFTSELPIFNTIQQHVPYLIFLLIYILAITLGASIIYLISYVFQKLSNNQKLSK